MIKKKVLQKFIAESGFCSRRKAQELIEAGKVSVNDQVAKLGSRVSEKDLVEVEGSKIKPKEKVYIKLNKPVGYTCTNRKFTGEKNVFDLVKTDERLFVAGRLDKNSRGLIVLTNDGDWTQKITHPSFEHEKEYEVRINKEIPLKKLKREFVEKGVVIDDKERVFVKKIEKLGDKKFRLILSEGRNRQIRKMFQSLKAEVLDLKRLRIDNINLGDLKEGGLTKISI
ncbi:MAG: pseudouridine synthase [Candidatus Moraniibacteriota bacterium]